MNGNQIAAEILRAAAQLAGNTWDRIRQSAPFYVKGFGQTLAEIGQGVARGEITVGDARMYTKNATLLLVMGIANTAQVVMMQVQRFITQVFDIVKGVINGALPIKLL